MQTFARKLNLIALALGAALTAPGCATDWFSSSSSDYVAGELSQDVENLPDPNAPPAPPKRSTIVSPLGAPFKESPDRLLLQANAYFEQGKFHDSARLYQKYLATPDAATAPPTVLGQAHYRIAVVARKKMSFAEAKREFETALRYEPQNQQYRFDLGKSAFDGADYATADAAFSALIAQNPNYPQAQYYYGLTLLEGTRRAEAIAPLTKAVGELEAAALLTDKYYALGEAENAAAWEAQTTQIAARLGRPVPAFPNKPAFASTAQPQAPAQVALAPQPQAPAQVAPVVQPQAPAQVAPVVQPQAPAQNAPVEQPQIPFAQLQGPTPFIAAVAPSTTETLVLPDESSDDANVAADEPRPLAVATPQAPAPQEDARQSTAETSSAPAVKISASAPALAEQDAKSAQNPAACIGRRNPGLFATSVASSTTVAAETGFRPGSISTTAPTPASTPQIAQNFPTAPTPQTSLVAQNAPIIGPRLPQPSRFDAETAFQRVESLVELENCVAEYFAPLAPIYETAPSPFPIADAQELYAVAPSPADLADVESEEFDENDDFAFASSGSSQAQSPAEPATIGGFGSYQAPTFDATPVAAAPVSPQVQPIAQSAPTAQTTLVPQYAQTTQVPLVPQNVYAAPTAQVAQNAPTAQTALVPQYAQTTQVPLVPQNAYAAPTTQVAQNAPTAVSQYAAPTVPRRATTPEERLQAAIAAGANVREISPEEYRRAVSVGMSGQTQPR